GDGRQVRAFELGPSWSGFYLVAAGHFTDPVRRDLYVGVQHPYYGRHQSRLLHGGSGEVLWESVPGLSYSPAAADLRGRGADDLVGMYYFTHVVLDGATGTTRFADANRPGYHTATVADVDGDGRLEVLFHSGYMTISCAEADGRRRWAVDGLNYNAGGAAALADVDGDGRLELAVAFRDGRLVCLDAATGQERWIPPLPGAGTDCLAGDVDGDGLPEIVVGCWDGNLYAVSGRGGAPTVLWSHPVGGAPGAPIMADADGDGVAEILVVGGDGYLYCLGGED
ncbi:MAG: FG-GAP-like repeat-containing protein, partial [Gemmatimonadota bacterium]